MKRQIYSHVWKKLLKKNKLYCRGVVAPTWSCTHRQVTNYAAAQNSSAVLNLQKRHLEICCEPLQDSLKLSYVWLRDHCRCSECYNDTTNQRNLDLLQIPDNIKPTSSNIQDNKLIVTWEDGHTSEYCLNWLRNNSYNNYVTSQTQELLLWDKHTDIENKVAREDINNYMSSDKALYNVVKSIVDYGVAIVTNVPAAVDATEKVVQKISHVQHTMFGGMWQFSDHYSHYDTAYTCTALGAHNDNTYFTEAAGLQVFHCLHHIGTGGETLLVDGFRAAHDLKQTHPASYKRLASLPIESEYIEPGRHYFSVEPVLKLHPITNQLQQIRFNLYDRAPMRTLPYEETVQLYQDLRLLAGKVKDPQGEWWFKLHPGTVLINQ
ncbi:hypothetical protein L9F63_010238 [Diploptera punctata]|uniref:Trimethyllysine dioxygenase, mitochondrial n=1 Tax=Diploptera punctata TaxID=6984 RepID=A0AAD8AII6_DIPPU|nr:hypothetical protein L9F63_010238 [Diploptera punctata]